MTENNNDKSIKEKSIKGFVWKSAEKVGSQLCSFIIQMVLARLLMPEDYGIIGLLTVFIAISNVFILQGFTTALIQKKDADEIDFSSVFFANLAIAFLLYGVLFFCSPLIAAFYEMPELIQTMRVLSLNIVFAAFGAVHNTIISKRLDFKISFIKGLCVTTTSGLIGIIFAYKGFGAWALVYSNLAGVMVESIVVWVFVKWIPKRLFSIKRLKSLFSFSSKILGDSLLNSIFNNIHSLVIGKFYTSSDLGFFNKGQNFPQTMAGAIDGSMSEVLYPAYALLQDNPESLKTAVRRALSLSMFIMMPAFFGLISTANAFVEVLFTSKWLPCVPYLQLSCLICLFWPLSTRTNAIKATGNSDVVLKLSVCDKVLSLISIFICIRLGMLALLIGTIITNSICFFISAFYSKKYLNYSLRELFSDILPSLLMSLLMGIVVYSVSFINLSPLTTLIIQVFLGVMVYILESIITKNSNFYYMIDTLKKLIGK